LNILDHSGRSGYICGIFRGSKTPGKTHVSLGEDYDVKVKDLKRHRTGGRGKIKGCIVWVMKSVKW
jgi:predicted RNA-binding protein with TRAM domain